MAPVDWSLEADYRTVIGIAEVRERIARQASLSERGMSAEEFLTSADKVLGPLGGISVPLLPVAKLGHALGSGLGIGTGKSRIETVEQPIGRVIVATLCSLARQGMAVEMVKQGDDGCVIEAVMPSSPFILAGALTVAVSRDEAGARVAAGAKVTGQMFDWGASKKALGNLIADIERFAAGDAVA